MTATLTEGLQKAADQVSRARDMLPPGEESQEAIDKAAMFLGRALIEDDDQERAECISAAETWAYAALKRGGYPDDIARGYSAVPGTEDEYA